MVHAHRDVVIVGGGLAGLIVARELTAAGRSVALVEARERLGGRVWFDSFADTEERVELGGSWVDPSYQPLVAAEIDRYGLTLVHGEPGLTPRNVNLGRLLPGGLPVSGEDAIGLERAVWECIASSRRIEYGRPWEQQDLEDLDISWTQYVRALALPPGVEEYLLTWTSASHPDDTSALNVLVLFTTFDHSAWAAYNSMELKFEHGTASLVDAIAAEIPAGSIHLGAVVSEIAQTNEAVRVTTADGQVFTGTTAVVATPVNTWQDVSFSPALSAGKQEVVRDGHVGTGQKLWLQLASVPQPGIFGWGFGKGIHWLLRDRVLGEGGDLYVAFTGAQRLDLQDHEAVRAAVRVFAPDAEVVRSGEHDWLEDPFAKGVWAVYRPGQFTRNHSELSRPEGRVHFAGGDLSFGLQLWIEGALESGFQVADRLLGD